MKQYIASALFQLKEATKYTQAGSSDNNSLSRHFSATISAPSTSCKKPPDVPSPKTGKLRRDSGCRSARRSLGTTFSGLRKLTYLLSCICCCGWLRGIAKKVLVYKSLLNRQVCWVTYFFCCIVCYSSKGYFIYVFEVYLTLKYVASVTLCHLSWIDHQANFPPVI